MTEPMECSDGICLPPHQAQVEQVDDDDSPHPKKEKQQAFQTKRGNRSSGSSSPNIRKIHTQQDLDRLVDSNDAVIVEFGTSWCGACREIEALWEELAAENVESVACAQVVCDQNKETKKLAAAHWIQSYPVFLAFRNGNLEQKWEGADLGKLEKAFEKLGGGGGRKGAKGGKKMGRR